MTIDELYKFVKLLANKENRGWIKPSEFNLLAKRAQLDLIKDRYGSASGEGIVNGYKANSQLWDELRPVISYNTEILNDGGGDFRFLNDGVTDIFATGNYLYYISGKFEGRMVDMLNMDEMEIRRLSHLNPPSPDFPCGVVSNEGIRVFIGGDSEDDGDFRLTYIQNPADPIWNFTVINNVEVYNPTNSVQFTLPESTHKEIAHRILSYLGVALREATMVEYSTASVLEQNK
tara:strand:- start:5000 stop:5695 length:696 start_codon:yes stop_codon:yes gene_type:complete